MFLLNQEVIAKLFNVKLYIWYYEKEESLLRKSGFENRILAKTLGLDVVTVQPLGPPTIGCISLYRIYIWQITVKINNLVWKGF